MGHIFSSAVTVTAAVLISAGSVACSGSDADSTASAPEGWAYLSPTELGPYPVGSITRVLVDESRLETSTPDDDTDVRTLVTEIWYPASAATADMEKDLFKNFFGDSGDVVMGLMASVFGTPEEHLDKLKEQRSGAVRDADIAAGGPFPVVLFSHGNQGFRFQSFFLTEFLASHGYIVIAADHTYNAGISQLPSGLVMYDGTSIAQFGLRVSDMSYLLDVLVDLNADDPDGRFTGKVDAENVGISGHSFGGMTAMQAVADDSRITVGAPMASGGIKLEAGLSAPLMHFKAEEDKTVAGADIEANYSDSAGARWILRVKDAGHFSFSDMCLLDPNFGDGCGEGTREDTEETFTFLDDEVAHDLTTYYETALFGYYLKGVDEYADDLVAEPFSDHVDFEYSRFP